MAKMVKIMVLILIICENVDRPLDGRGIEGGESCVDQDHDIGDDDIDGNGNYNFDDGADDIDGNGNDIFFSPDDE